MLFKIWLDPAKHSFFDTDYWNALFRFGESLRVTNALYVDKNKSGYLTLDEFMNVLKCYQIDVSEHKALELFAMGDNDCSGLIDADGMRRVVSKLQNDIEIKLFPSAAFIPVAYPHSLLRRTGLWAP